MSPTAATVLLKRTYSLLRSWWCIHLGGRVHARTQRAQTRWLLDCPGGSCCSRRPPFGACGAHLLPLAHLNQLVLAEWHAVMRAATTMTLSVLEVTRAAKKQKQHLRRSCGLWRRHRLHFYCYQWLCRLSSRHPRRGAQGAWAPQQRLCDYVCYCVHVPPSPNELQSGVLYAGLLAVTNLPGML